jgi:membrane-associated phospholipid phosphatase
MRAPTAAAVVVLWRRRDRRLAAWLVAVAFAGWALQQVMKSAVCRHRPRWSHPVDSAHFSAFPSGHAMSAPIACGPLLWR